MRSPASTDAVDHLEVVLGESPHRVAGQHGGPCHLMLPAVSRQKWRSFVPRRTMTSRSPPPYEL
jgi:hypothetical protein